MTNMLDHFRSGKDYLDIARMYATTEAEVEKEIHRLRKIEWSGCVPAEIYTKPVYPARKIPYAGAEVNR